MGFNRRVSSGTFSALLYCWCTELRLGTGEVAIGAACLGFWLRILPLWPTSFTRGKAQLRLMWLASTFGSSALQLIVQIFICSTILCYVFCLGTFLLPLLSFYGGVKFEPKSCWLKSYTVSVYSLSYWLSKRDRKRLLVAGQHTLAKACASVNSSILPPWNLLIVHLSSCLMWALLPTLLPVPKPPLIFCLLANPDINDFPLQASSSKLL